MERRPLDPIGWDEEKSKKHPTHGRALRDKIILPCHQIFS
jgi:hypothetical protein